jgi:hypothetical protein
MNNSLKDAVLLNVIALMAGTSGTGGTASLSIRAGNQPTSAESAGTGGTLCVIAGIGWGAATTGTASFATAGGYVGTAGSTGVPGWARLECINDSGTCRIDGDVGTSAAATFTINVASLTEDGEVTVTAADITLT